MLIGNRAGAALVRCSSPASRAQAYSNPARGSLLTRWKGYLADREHGAAVAPDTSSAAMPVRKKEAPRHRGREAGTLRTGMRRSTGGADTSRLQCIPALGGAAGGIALVALVQRGAAPDCTTALDQRLDMPNRARALEADCSTGTVLRRFSRRLRSTASHSRRLCVRSQTQDRSQNPHRKSSLWLPRPAAESDTRDAPFATSAYGKSWH